jgi:acetoin utilization deacetylase AcuC-like enzyme
LGITDSGFLDANVYLSSLGDMQLFYTDVFELPLPDNHRFPMSKYRLLRERLAAHPYFSSDAFEIPPAATDAQLLLAHTAEYLDKIRSGQLTPTEMRRIGFPWSEKLVERSRRSTGATISAARAALIDNVSANLAGGTHHAFSNAAEGYCVFNDVCVALRVLQQERLAFRPLVIDCDVHQGNGTAEILSGDPTAFCLSIHCQGNFPFRKQTSSLDVALPVGVDDTSYLRELQSALDVSIRSFTPDFVFYVAGADPFEHDRLGKMKLTKAGLKQRDQVVFQFCRDQQLPVAISMAGGYAAEIEDIVEIHASTIITGYEMLAKRS